MDSGDRQGRVRRLLDAGSEIAGSVAGATAGLLVGDAGGAVVGAAIGTAIGYSLSDVADRVLSQREQARVGAAASYAAERLQVLLADGHELRADGFFSEEPDARAPGLEIAEGVLLAARTTFEERKVRHIGYLLANVAVLPEIDAALASAQLRSAEQLTWRQLLLLEIVGRQDDGDLQLPEGQLRTPAGSWLEWGVYRDLIEIDDTGYITGKREVTARAGLVLRSTEMRKLLPTDRGKLLRTLLSLDEVPQGDIDEIVGLLEAGAAVLAAAIETPDAGPGSSSS